MCFVKATANKDTRKYGAARKRMPSTCSARRRMNGTESWWWQPPKNMPSNMIQMRHSRKESYWDRPSDSCRRNSCVHGAVLVEVVLHCLGSWLTSVHCVVCPINFYPASHASLVTVSPTVSRYPLYPWSPTGRCRRVPRTSERLLLQPSGMFHRDKPSA